MQEDEYYTPKISTLKYCKNTIKNNCGQNKHHTKVVVLKFYILYHTKVVDPSEIIFADNKQNL